MTTKTIEVTSCDTCPYNSGWDPMGCEQKEMLKNYERSFCIFWRATMCVGEDLKSKCVDRNKMTGKLPFPDWCPLPYKTRTPSLSNRHTIEWLDRIGKKKKYEQL